MTSTKGYTLIEIFIVISIITIFFTIGVAGYREFSNRQALSGISKQILGDLRSAQQLALTGQKPTVCARLTGYTFAMITSTTYRVSAVCTDTTTTIKTITLPTNTTISAGSVLFKVLGQGTNLSTPLTFTIANTRAGTSNTIVIGTGGEIQ